MSENGERLYYRLPITVARFSGDVVETTDPLQPNGSQTSIVRSGSAIVDVRADPRGEPNSIALGRPELEKLRQRFSCSRTAV
jgi:hypothetical protein